MDGYATLKRKQYRDDGRVLIALTVGNSSGCEDLEFLLLGELFDEIGAKLECDMISLELLDRLEVLSHITAAFTSACASLTYTQCSAKALFRKLLSKGFSKYASEEAVELCVLRGYIDEISSSVRRAEIMVGKHWGRLRILAKLKEEGYAESALSHVSLQLDETDFAENCAEIVRKKYSVIPDDRKEREKMYASLKRLGFSTSDIRDAFRIIENE